MYLRKSGEMSTAYTVPSGPTRSAKRRVNRPVPAPTSAIAMPGFRSSAPTIAARALYTSRDSLWNRLTHSATSGDRNGLLISDGSSVPGALRGRSGAWVCARTSSARTKGGVRQVNIHRDRFDMGSVPSINMNGDGLSSGVEGPDDRRVVGVVIPLRGQSLEQVAMERRERQAG